MQTRNAEECSDYRDEGGAVVPEPEKHEEVLLTLERAFSVLEELARHREIGVCSLAKTLGFSRTSTHRILATLKKLGYVSQDSESGKYRLALRLFELGSRVVERLGLKEQASFAMKMLALKYNETVNLALLDGTEIVYIDKIESSEPLRMGLRVGTRVPAHCSALGKALLAQLPSEDLDRYLEHAQLKRYTPSTIVSASDLKHELERIRAQGFSFDNEEYILGIRCVAAPIYNHRSEAVAAVSIAGPSMRLDLQRIYGEVARDVIQCARHISAALGYSPIIQERTDHLQVADEHVEQRR